MDHSTLSAIIVDLISDGFECSSAMSNTKFMSVCLVFRLYHVVKYLYSSRLLLTNLRSVMASLHNAGRLFPRRHSLEGNTQNRLA
jgi:hypothetical protein